MKVTKVIFESEVRRWTNELIADIKKELTAQGHRATGKLIDTIEAEYREEGDAFIMELTMQHYARFVDTGFRPKFSRPGRKKVSKYIEALIGWLAVKQIGKSNERLGIAIAIATVAKKTKHPTPGSYSFSKNGRRKNWSEHSINKKVLKLPEELRLENFVSDLFERQLMELRT